MRRKSWYRLLLCGVLFAICFPISAQDLDNDTGYKAQLATIESKLQVGDLENALKHIEETLVQYPRGAEVHYAKSRSEERRVGKEGRSRWSVDAVIERTERAVPES